MSDSVTLECEENRTGSEPEIESNEKEMDSPVKEKASLELTSVNSEYGTQNGAEGPRPHSDSDPDDLIDRDQFESAWWAKLFPFLLKWPWFRKYSLKKKKKARGQWDNRAQYLLTLVGYAVGLGNVWRFSYLVAKNGGATFVIPYLIMLLIVGIPLFYLETTLGQTLQKGPILAWYKICPNLWGIGLASAVVSVLISIYYNVIISWVILYFFNSFQDPLPWSKCFGTTIDSINSTDDYLADRINNSNFADYVSCLNDSTRYYWYQTTLEASSGIGIAGVFNWRLFLTLFAAWVIVYLCVFRGIQSSGKVVYFTATFPYLMLLVLFFRAVILPGAGDGLEFLFIPEADIVREKFLSPQVWLEAATQIFFSLGLSVGALIALSSYSKPTNNSLIDTLIVCLTNSFTSIFASIVVFSIVGFKARQANISPELAAQGPGLAFVVFSEALTLLPLSPLWAVLFFIMLFLLGLDSQFATIEGVITVVYDSKTVRKLRKEIGIAIICAVLFLVSIPFTLGNGLYLFQLFDQFAATLPLLFIGFCEIVTIAYLYGVDRFLDRVEYKIPSALKFFWWIVWMFVTPVIMLVIFVGSIVSELVNPLEYTVFHADEEYAFNGSYTQRNVEFRTDSPLPYPGWAQLLGAVLVLMTILCIPVVFIIRLVIYAEARQQIIQFRRDTEQRFLHFIRSVRNRTFFSHSWSPDSSEDIPYQSCDDEGGVTGKYVSVKD